MDSSACIKNALREKVNNAPVLTITLGYATSIILNNELQMNSRMTKRIIHFKCHHKKKDQERKKNKSGSHAFMHHL